jgi:hypothetical protein
MKPSASTATPIAKLGLTLCLTLALAGCASDGTTFGKTTGAPANGIYVIQNAAASGTLAASGSVLQFSSTATGAAAPTATIANLDVTSLGFLAVDGTGNIYTAATEGTTGTSLLEFPVGSQNNAQPTRSIPFNATTALTAIGSLSADSTGVLYASTGAGSVSIFSASTTRQRPSRLHQARAHKPRPSTPPAISTSLPLRQSTTLQSLRSRCSLQRPAPPSQHAPSLEH